jgi:hypothetical protein
MRPTIGTATLRFPRAPRRRTGKQLFQRQLELSVEAAYRLVVETMVEHALAEVDQRGGSERNSTSEPITSPTSR